MLHCHPAGSQSELVGEKSSVVAAGAGGGGVGRHLEELRADAAERLAEMHGRIQEILDDLHVDAERFDLPELPEPELDGDQPWPLWDSGWGFAEQCAALKASKRYDDLGDHA